MKGVRMERVQEEIRREVSEILSSRARDPRLGWVSVVRVEVSPDLSVAKLYVSVLGDEANQEATLRVLSGARSFVRAELGRRVHLRRTPELFFRADQGLSSSFRIAAILKELGMTEERPKSEDEE